MALTHRVTKLITYSGTNVSSETFSFSDTQTAGSFIELSEAIPDSSTDLLVAMTLDISQASTLFISSNYAITIETNDGTTPDDTLAVSPTAAIVWSAGDGTTIPLTADVTALYVTNSSGSEATLVVKALYDPTV